MKKKKQHYVWKKYLRAWATNEKIACLRDGVLFESNLEGVAQERYFYKLKELTSEDLNFIKVFAIDQARPHLQKLHKNFIEDYGLVFKLRKRVEKVGSSLEIDKELDEAIHNLEEELHSGIETAGHDYLECILKEDLSFYSDVDKSAQFLYFLAVQYMRTKRMKQTVFYTIKKLNPSYEAQFERTWNLLSHIFAINIGASIYAERSKFNMILLKNDSPKEFITADQPVVNSCVQDGSPTPPEKVELYYPVSPRLAVLITEDEKKAGMKCSDLCEDDVNLYNKLMVENSLEQLYATSLSALKEYMDCTVVGGKELNG